MELRFDESPSRTSLTLTGTGHWAECLLHLRDVIRYPVSGYPVIRLLLCLSFCAFYAFDPHPPISAELRLHMHMALFSVQWISDFGKRILVEMCNISHNSYLGGYWLVAVQL